MWPGAQSLDDRRTDRYANSSNFRHRMNNLGLWPMRHTGVGTSQNDAQGAVSAGDAGSVVVVSQQ